MDLFHDERFNAAALLESRGHRRGTPVFDTILDFAVDDDASLVEALLVGKSIIAARMAQRASVACQLRSTAMPAELRGLRVSRRSVVDGALDADAEDALVARFCEMDARQRMHAKGWASLCARDPWRLFQIQAADLTRPLTEIAVAAICVTFTCEGGEARFHAHIAEAEILSLTTPENLAPGARTRLFPLRDSDDPSAFVVLEGPADAETILRPTATDRWLETRNADASSAAVQLPDPRTHEEFAWRFACVSGLDLPTNCRFHYVRVGAEVGGTCVRAPALLCQTSLVPVPRRRATDLVYAIVSRDLEDCLQPFLSSMRGPSRITTGHCPFASHGMQSARTMLQAHRQPAGDAGRLSTRCGDLDLALSEQLRCLPQRPTVPRKTLQPAGSDGTLTGTMPANLRRKARATKVQPPKAALLHQKAPKASASATKALCEGAATQRTAPKPGASKTAKAGTSKTRAPKAATPRKTAISASAPKVPSKTNVEVDESASMQNIAKWKVPQLRAWLRERKQRSTGKKAELLARIRESMKQT